MRFHRGIGIIEYKDTRCPLRGILRKGNKTMFMMKVPESALYLLYRLNQAGFEAYIVGGAVRNALLSQHAHDIDICTDALPEDVLTVFHDMTVIPTGIRHGTVTVVVRHVPYEITTYRTESGYQDHRHPDSVSFTNALREDLSRRDFTVNAMCWHPQEGLIDLFGGERDLQDEIIRTVGDPYQRFDEDALRILRALRFAARLGFSIEETTAKALKELSGTLSLISKERITAELKGILEAESCADMLYEYRSVFEVVLPQLKQLSEEQYLCMRERVRLSEADCIARLALWFSDADPSWQKELTLSNAEYTSVCDLMRHKADPLETTADLRKLLSALKVSSHTYAVYRNAYDRECSLDESRLRDILERGDCISLKQLDLNGNDLTSAGYKGKQIADLLNACLTAVMEDRVPNEKKDLLALCEQISQ